MKREWDKLKALLVERQNEVNSNIDESGEMQDSASDLSLAEAYAVLLTCESVLVIMEQLEKGNIKA